MNTKLDLRWSKFEILSFEVIIFRSFLCRISIPNRTNNWGTRIDVFVFSTTYYSQQTNYNSENINQHF